MRTSAQSPASAMLFCIDTDGRAVHAEVGDGYDLARLRTDARDRLARFHAVESRAASVRMVTMGRDGARRSRPAGAETLVFAQAEIASLRDPGRADLEG